MATLVRMPEVLTGITEAAIQTWLVAEGETVAVGTPIAEVETEKAVVEYAAETAGTVLKLIAAAGASVNIGDPIAAVAAAGTTARTSGMPCTPHPGPRCTDSLARPGACSPLTPLRWRRLRHPSTTCATCAARAPLRCMHELPTSTMP